MPTIRNIYTNYLAQLHLKSFPQKMPNKAFLEDLAEVSPLCGYRNTQGLLQNCTAKTAGLEDTGVSEGDALHRSKEQGRFPQISHFSGQRMVMITSKQSITLLKGHGAGTHTHTREQTWTQHTEHRALQVWHVPATQLPVPGSQDRCRKDAAQAPRVNFC